MELKILHGKGCTMFDPRNPTVKCSCGCEAQAKLTAREIMEWGEKPCVEHSEVEWPEELGGGTEHRQKVKRRRCQHCWQALKEKLEAKC